MKSFCSLLVLSALTISAYAQPKSNLKPAPEAQVNIEKDTTPFEMKVYEKAMLFGDLMVAKNEIFQMIAKYPDKLGYLDSLARIYFSLGAYPQSLLAAKIVLEKEPKNLAMMELSAISYNELGSKKEALDTYEKLYPQTKSLNHLYQIAVLQFGLQRFGECTATTDAILADPKAEQEKMSMNIDQNQQQEVPLKAAIYNLRGVMFKEMSQNDKAKESFDQALKIFPEFALAKSNLELMKKASEQPAADGKKDEKKK